MAILRNQKKLSAASKETSENTKKNQSQNSLNPRMAEESITHVSEDIERRVIKKLSQEFNRTKTRIFDALYKLNEFLLN